MRNAGLWWYWKRKRARAAVLLLALATEAGDLWTFKGTDDYIILS